MADPVPPVPSDADLTDFRFMPLEVGRLRRSKAWLICKRRPELAFFMLNLWTAAWHERPAGSLEDDDDVLADAAMCSPDRWAKIRKDVMRGWFKASDGRLYHAVVAEKVMDSWYGKMHARWRKECERTRKENARREKKQLPPLDLPPEPTRPAASCPEDEPETSKDVRGRSADEPRTGDGNPAENALKGREREGKGSKEEDSAAASRARGPNRDGDDPPEPVPAEPNDPSLDGGGSAAEKPPRSRTAGKPEDQALALYQAAAAAEGWPDAGYLTSTRRMRLGPILAVCGGVPGFAAVLDRAKAAAFLHDEAGHTHGWFDFDWLLDEQHFARLMEGRYDVRSEPKPRAQANSGPAHGGTPTVHDGVAAAFARRSVSNGG